MFDSALIDIAIGLSLVFLMFSLLVSAAGEMFASGLKWRSKHLWEGIEKLLRSDLHRNTLYEHPLIKGLSTSLGLGASVNVKRGKYGPSYIPSKTFALALLDIIRDPHRAAAALLRKVDALKAKLAADPKAALTEIDAALTEALTQTGMSARMRDDLAALKHQWLEKADQQAVAPVVKQVEAVIAMATDPAIKQDLQQWITIARDATGIEIRAELDKAIERVPDDPATHRVRVLLTQAADSVANGDPKKLRDAIDQFSASVVRTSLTDIGGELQRSLGALLDDAANNADRFRENIEIWFNDGMERVSGLYKRHTMKWHFGIAMFLAIALNIDSLLMARALWREPTLRKSLAAQGAAVVEAPPPSLVRPPNAAEASDGGTQLKVQLAADSVRSGAEETVYVDLTPAPAQDTPVQVSVKSAHVSVKDPNQPITIGQGRTRTAFLVQADSTDSESHERIEVAAGSLSVPLEFIVIQPADKQFRKTQQQLASLGLPMGWSCGTDNDGTLRTLPFWCQEGGAIGGGRRRWFLNTLALVLGWLITASAASLGAPFWFDLLKRVVAIRSAGKAPEERPLSPKEVSQPREPGQRPVEADTLKALARR